MEALGTYMWVWIGGVTLWILWTGLEDAYILNDE